MKEKQEQEQNQRPREIVSATICLWVICDYYVIVTARTFVHDCAHRSTLIKSFVTLTAWAVRGFRPLSRRVNKISGKSTDAKVSISEMGFT